MQFQEAEEEVDRKGSRGQFDYCAARPEENPRLCQTTSGRFMCLLFFLFLRTMLGSISCCGYKPVSLTLERSTLSNVAFPLH